MRLVIVLAVAAAVTVMLGAILVAASVVMRLLTRHEPANMTRLGLDVVAAGVVFGLVVLVLFAIARIGTGGASRPPVAAAQHRRGAVGPQPEAASPEYGQPSGRGTSQGHRQDRLRAGARPAGSGQGGARSGRPSVLNPTNVYSPGGLLDMPRDGRAPGAPAGQDIPEILRTAGPPPRPGAPGGPGAPEARERLARVRRLAGLELGRHVRVTSQG